MSHLELKIAAKSVQNIPKDAPLSDRIKYAMRYVRDHERDVFWMSAGVNDDAMFRTALAAVMLAGSEEDRDIINRSMQPLRMLSAAMSGAPVDFGAMQVAEDLLPLMKLWRETDPA